MKEQLASMLRRLITPSLRTEVRNAAVWLHEQRDRVQIWHWELVCLQADHSPYDVFYFGRKGYRALALALLGIDPAEQKSAAPSGLDISPNAAYVADVPLPGSLRVPGSLRAIVPLGRSIEEITARYDEELRRRLRKQRPRFHTARVVESSEVERVDRELIRPYATERQGNDAIHQPPGVVRDMALRYGQLDLVYCDGEEVGCHLGYVFTQAGKRYWVTSRFGYPAAVFSNRKRLAETNSMNTYLALEFAVQNGFDYYDIGGCLGRPEDGLLQWKRRRGGAVYRSMHHDYLYVRLPKRGKAQFLWNTPLFGVESSGLTLWLGLPEGPSDEEAANRYREMGFSGLSKVYVQCARSPGQPFVERMNHLFAHEKAPPIVENVRAD